MKGHTKTGHSRQHSKDLPKDGNDDAEAVESTIKYLRALLPIFSELTANLNGFIDGEEGLSGGTKTLQEQSLCLRQALNQIQPQAIELSRNQRGSKLIEKLLKIQLLVLQLDEIAETDSVKAFHENWATIDVVNWIENILNLTTEKHFMAICCGMYSSHVLETVLAVVFRCLYQTSRAPSQSITQLEKAFVSFCLQLSDSFETLMQRPSASHILCAALALLSGNAPDKYIHITKSNDGKPTKASKTPSVAPHFAVSAHFEQAFAKMGSYLMHFLDTHSISAALDSNHCLILQSYFEQLAHRYFNSPEMSKFLDHVIPKSTQQLQQLDTLVDGPVTSRLIEKVVKHAPVPELERFVLHFIPQKTSLLCLGACSNHVLQNLLENNFFSPELLTLILTHLPFDQVFEKFPNVILKVASACSKLQTSQNLFCDNMLNVLVERRTHPSVIWTLLLATKSKTDVAGTEACTQLAQSVCNHDDKNPARTHSLRLRAVGCKLALSLLSFQPDALKPILQDFKTFLGWQDGLVELACHRDGSRFVEGLFNSPSHLSLKQRKKLLTTLLPHMPMLADNPHGSFVVSAAYKAVETQQQTLILQSLKASHKTIKTRNPALEAILGLSLYTESTEDWLRVKNDKRKVETLFRDILEAPPKKVKAAG